MELKSKITKDQSAYLPPPEMLDCLGKNDRMGILGECASTPWSFLLWGSIKQFGKGTHVFLWENNPHH